MNKEPPSLPPEDLKFEAGLELRTLWAILDKSFFPFAEFENNISSF